ncbi:hypothetical protein QTP88_025390 [Uroleucon formosanum]
MLTSRGAGSSGTQKSTKPTKRSSSTALSPPSVNKNRYSPLSNLNEDDNDDNMSLVTQSDGDEARQSTEEKDTPPKCVNCEKSHPASYRGCTYYKEISKSKNKFNSKQPVNNKNITYHSTQPIVNNESHNEPLSNDYLNTKRKTYASAAKSNITTDNDFLKTLLPLINTFVSQLMQKIIESLPVIINSINSNLNVQP